MEWELRKRWWRSEKATIWSYLTITLSESSGEKPFWKKLWRLEGRLQGHAPVVGNAGIFYSHYRWESAIFLNYTASQIWAMGFDAYKYPHIVEEKRLVGEAQVSYRIGKRWEIRLAVWDFINQPYRRTQRLGNADTFREERDALAIWERWAYRAYLTMRYKW
ncbi:MAG: hypothetical protein RMJ66_01075 [Bacteroidia bacterium]|nr:hypothetical protein [Bacteroidia bacterium]MDW8133635.1 hypothetical protein [Bacteroidia bacterium]